MENRALIHREIEAWEYPGGRMELRAGERQVESRQYDRLTEVDQGAIVACSVWRTYWRSRRRCRRSVTIAASARRPHARIGGRVAKGQACNRYRQLIY
jgi:hypothetical protein